MKKSLSKVSLAMFMLVVLFSCNQMSNKQKEQSIKDSQSVQGKKVGDSTSLKQIAEEKTEKYNFKSHNDVQIFWNDFKGAIVAKDKESLKRMCINPIPSYYYDSKSEISIERLFEPEFVNQIKKVQKLDKTKAAVVELLTNNYDIKKDIPVYQLMIDGWEFSGACLYFTLVDGEYKLVGIDSWENEG